MSTQLLDGLSAASQILMQLAVRHEYAPLHYARVPPLDEAAAMLAANELAERGLLKPAEEAPGVLLLTPVGYALKDAVLARWDALHAEMRPRLVQHLAKMYDLEDDSLLMAALNAVDRAAFLPDRSRPLADLDLPAPLGIDEMTTSAPHAIAAMLRASAPVPGDRMLVCGAKGGVTIALGAHMVGAEGVVVGLDTSVGIADMAAGSLASAGSAAEVRRTDDVTVGVPDEGPWDVVVVNGSVPKIPWDLVDQLRNPGGRLLMFLQEAATEGQTCYILHRDGEVLRDELLSQFVFTPIFGRWGWDRVSDSIRR